MKTILILYVSTTGNTEAIAQLLQDAIDPDAFRVTLQEVSLGDADTLDLTQYDGILFGTHTYDDGDLPFETDVFIDELPQASLSRQIVGVFGSGDTSYSYFCGAVDIMVDEFTDRHAIVLEPAVKVDLYPDQKEDFSAIHQLAVQLQKTLVEKG